MSISQSLGWLWGVMGDVDVDEFVGGMGDRVEYSMIEGVGLEGGRAGFFGWIGGKFSG